MRKLLTGMVVVAILIGFAAGSITVTTAPANATDCVLEPEPFIWIGGECLPEVGNPKDFAYNDVYRCLGYWGSTGEPCLCTYLGCQRPRTGGSGPGSPGAG